MCLELREEFWSWRYRFVSQKPTICWLEWLGSLGIEWDRSDLGTQTWEIPMWKVQSEWKENWKGMFKDGISWSNINRSQRKKFKNEVDNSRKYYGERMILAFWGPALPTIPAFWSDYDYSYIQNSHVKRTSVWQCYWHNLLCLVTKYRKKKKMADVQRKGRPLKIMPLFFHSKYQGCCKESNFIEWAPTFYAKLSSVKLSRLHICGIS